MDPFTIALIGSMALGGIGSIMGGNAEEEAAERQQQIDMMNYNQRERERRDRIRMADQQRRDEHLGSTNARGDRSRFIEGQGWVTELGKDSKAIDQAQIREQLAVLMQDLPARRRLMQENISRQGRERYTAGGFEEELRRIEREDPRHRANLMREIATRGINEGFDAQGNRALKTATRMGSSNAGSIIASLANSRGKALSEAFQDAELKALEATESNFNNKRGAVSNLYNMFAERSGRMPDVSYRPENVSESAESMLRQFAGQSSQAGANLAAAFGQQGGTMGPARVNDGMAKSLVSMGSLLNSGANSWDAHQGRIGAYGDAGRFYESGRRRGNSYG